MLSDDNNHSTIHLDGEKTMNENNFQYVSFFSVADDLLIRGNQMMYSSQDMRNTLRSNGSSVIITDKSNDAFGSRGALPFASVTNKQP